MPQAAGIRHAIGAARAVLERMEADAALHGAAAEAARLVVAALRGGGKLLLCGNGGSAADAQHWAAELVSRFHFDRPGLAALALTVDSSALTGIGNDYGYERVFARQVEALGRPGDVLFGLSTSGRSPNVLAAMAAARGLGLRTVGFTGNGPGAAALAAVSDVLVQVPSASTPAIQEGHEVLGHAICAMVERAMFPGGARG